MCETPMPETPFPMAPQPDDTSCGPTCLHAVYRHFDDLIPLHQLVDEVGSLDEGGTLATVLGSHALRRGYHATLHSYNLSLFDPTWYGLDRAALVAKLEAQARLKDDPKLDFATRATIEFLGLGGQIRFEDLSPELLRQLLIEGRPVLTGLSATYLYREAREIGATDEEDDLRGLPVGHFVVLCGLDLHRRQVRVADPLHPNPLNTTHLYEVGVDRLISAILLGVLTYDANLLQIAPTSRSRGRSPEP